MFAALCTLLVALSARQGVSRLRRASTAIAMPLLLAALAMAVGLRVNLSDSMPIGLYRMISARGDPHRNELVIACVPDRDALLGRNRGYIGRGPCANGSAPVLKMIAGIAGDDVHESPSGVTMSGCRLRDSRPLLRDEAGRALRPWHTNLRLPRGTVWLAAVAARSWDSRYWGPIPTSRLLGVAQPLITGSRVRAPCGS